jgi:hypothetical protein
MKNSSKTRIVVYFPGDYGRGEYKNVQDCLRLDENTLYIKSSSGEEITFSRMAYFIEVQP